MWKSFYTKGLFRCAHAVCTWNITVSLQQMHIKGNIQGYLENHIIWKLMARGPMWVVSWHAYLESRQGTAWWILILHGLDNKPDTKNHLSIGALSVERPMLVK